MSAIRGTAMSIVLLAGALAACGPGDGQQAPSTAPTRSETTAPDSATPSITREVPPEQQRSLADVPLRELCGLVSAEELAELGAPPVERGKPREIGFEPPARGCVYESTTGPRSVLVGVQQAGFGALGHEEVDLGTTRGTQTLHANDCTVYTDVRGATLQVTVRQPEAETEQCDTAQSIAQYVLSAVRH